MKISTPLLGAGAVCATILFVVFLSKGLDLQYQRQEEKIAAASLKWEPITWNEFKWYDDDGKLEKRKFRCTIAFRASLFDGNFDPRLTIIDQQTKLKEGMYRADESREWSHHYYALEDHLWLTITATDLRIEDCAECERLIEQLKSEK